MQNCKLKLEEGENVETRSPGAFSPDPSGRWRLGDWIKTNQRLLFLQGGTPKFSVGFDLFVEITPCEREYSFKNAECLKIFFNDGDGNKTFWFITPNIASWRERFSEYLEGSITEDDISRVANQLGHDAEKILWFLYRKQHATISEISNLIGTGSHMDALNILRKEINQTAGEVIGRPLLVFKQECRNQKGRKIAYSWWFTGSKVAKDSPFCDIIDEDKFYRIIVESPSDTEEELKDNHLNLKNRCGFEYSITMPPNASNSINSRSYRNGVLELCVLKQGLNPKN